MNRPIEIVEGGSALSRSEKSILTWFEDLFGDNVVQDGNVSSEVVQILLDSFDAVEPVYDSNLATQEMANMGPVGRRYIENHQPPEDLE